MHNERTFSIQLILCTLLFPPDSEPILITVQAFLRDNKSVPLSMTHQSLYLNVETQVAIAGVILAGVYILIIFEVNGSAFSRTAHVVFSSFISPYMS